MQCGDMYGTPDCLDWDSTTVLGQYFLFAVTLQTALTDMAYFLFFFFSCFSFHINVSMKKRKTLSVSGTVTFLFFKVRRLFPWLLLRCYFTLIKKGTKF